MKHSALAHLPSGRFTANAAWLVLACEAFNLTRAAGTIAGGKLTKATTGTIRRTLINVPARIATSGRRLDWGTVPAWAGSILTSGSLVLGFRIIRRDRRRQDRRQASAVLLTLDGKYKSPWKQPFADASIELMVHNASTAPVTYVRVIYSPFPDECAPIIMTDETTSYTMLDFQAGDNEVHDLVLDDRIVGAKPLAAGDTRTFTVEIPNYYKELPWSNIAQLCFYDISNQCWVRDSLTGSLRVERPRRWHRALELVLGRDRRRKSKVALERAVLVKCRFAEDRAQREASGAEIRQQFRDRELEESSKLPNEEESTAEADRQEPKP